MMADTSSRSFTRQEVAQLICRGHLLVLHRRAIYRLNSWAKSHPAGSLAILHFVGRDASDEIEAYHCDATLKRMKAFIVGQAKIQDGSWTDERGWTPLMPPVQISKGWEILDDHVWLECESWKEGLAWLDGKSCAPSPRTALPPITPADIEPSLPPDGIVPEQQHQISLDYRKLHDRIIAEGLYKSMPLHAYRWEIARYLSFFVVSMLFFFLGSSLVHLYLSAIFLGFFKHQLTFLAHDAGHVGVMGNYFWDRVLGIFIADFLGGLSIGWWCDNHNIHHLVTNHTDHDPDIQHMPFFAISTRFLNNIFSTYYRRTLDLDALGRFVLPIQHRLYYFLMMFGRPNLFVNSYSYLLKKAKPGFFRNLELIGITFFWTWFTLMLRTIPSWKHRLGYVLVCFIVTSPLHVQIVLSHFARSTEDCGPYESFAHRQLRTTMDVACPEHLEWLHGGLQRQVSHHLFPRIPRHNLKRATVLVKEFAEQHKDAGLDYAIYGFLEGNGRVLDVLREVAGQVKVLAKVAEAQAKGELH